MESCRLFGGRVETAEPFMAAMELIHTYSLVHDDLPAMDNDLYRRGRKTTHAVYGEALGILAGDGLLNYAFETALSAFSQEGTDGAVLGKALQILAGKAGIYGMIGGQTVDVEGICGREEKEKLAFIYEKKTAALIEASFMMGALLGGASQEAVSAMELIGRKVGLAFQIQDDILDITSTTEVLGKPVFSDEKNQKITYVSLYGLEASRQAVAALSREAEAQLEQLETAGDKQFLSELIKYLIGREK
jgi:geranylgeranyl diphosphate synthase type II